MFDFSRQLIERLTDALSCTPSSRIILSMDHDASAEFRVRLISNHTPRATFTITYLVLLYVGVLRSQNQGSSS